MRIHALTRVLAAAGLVAVMVPATAAAADPAAVTYHGTWTDGEYCGLDAGVFTGVWNVTLKPDGTANASVRISEDGKLHAAWGGQWWGQAWTQAPAGDNDFVLTNARGPLSLTLTLDGSQLVYELDGVCEAMGFTGDAFVYGELDR